jgi:hypothetical protein
MTGLFFSDVALCVIGIINGFAEKLKSILKEFEATTFSLCRPVFSIKKHSEQTFENEPRNGQS